MKQHSFSIIEIGSNNTKTHIYENEKSIYENNTTIEFKKNYFLEKKVNENDMKKLYAEIEKALDYTNYIYLYGCSIFRIISEKELEEINQCLFDKFHLKIEVVSQEDEALLTAYGCYGNIDYDGNICVFIGGGGSTELVMVNNKKVIEKQYLDFGVVDITNKFETLKDDVPTYSFDEVYTYIASLVGTFDHQCDLLILAGGDHPYWYHNAEYELSENTLFKNDNQKNMITIEKSDQYDQDAMVTSLNRIKNNSDNPLWFDGARAMKMLTNVISHKIHAKYIIPTKINMEDGLSQKIRNAKLTTDNL